MSDVIIHEVGLRDGLQIEKKIVPLDVKIKWAYELLSSGVPIVQLGSFVHPKLVPQMADSDELFKNVRSSATLSGLVLNEKGLERGTACGVGMFCMGVSASDTHSRKNTRMSTEEALERVIAMALQIDGEVQVSVQSAFGCGFEGEIPMSRVIGLVDKYLDHELYNISLADTAGHANPAQVGTLIEIISNMNSNIRLTCHFHDTYGLGLANCYAAFMSGARRFESAFAGLGGCPFTAKASGNVCTEDLVHMFQEMGLCQDIDIDKIASVARQAEQFFGRALPGKTYKIRSEDEAII